MNWITNLIQKKPSNIANIKDIPSNLWIKCPSCSTLLFKKDLEKNLHVCNHCEYHFFLPVEKRLELLFGPNYCKIDLPSGLEDPLKFKDIEKYSSRLKRYRESTSHNDAIIAGYGKIGLVSSVVAVMNFEFMAGSMGTAVGEGFVAALDYAITKKVPFIVCSCSGGARMQEGMLSLMQMAKTTVAVEKLKEAGLPYIVLLTHPTTGGVTASFAMLGDIHITEPHATIAFAGARVIEQTIRKKLPEGFQTAEFLLEHGMVDLVCERSALKEKLASILEVLIKKEI